MASRNEVGLEQANFWTAKIRTMASAKKLYEARLVYFPDAEPALKAIWEAALEQSLSEAELLSSVLRVITRRLDGLGEQTEIDFGDLRD